MRRVSKKLHLWLSLPLGLIISLICLSGAVLAFEQELTTEPTCQAAVVTLVTRRPLLPLR